MTEQKVMSKKQVKDWLKDMLEKVETVPNFSDCYKKIADFTDLLDADINFNDEEKPFVPAIRIRDDEEDNIYTKVSLEEILDHLKKAARCQKRGVPFIRHWGAAVEVIYDEDF